MATINVSEADFEAVAGAAWEAKFNGREEEAASLDKIARKINCALSNRPRSPIVGSPIHRLTWRDVPSVFETGSGNTHAS